MSDVDLLLPVFS